LLGERIRQRREEKGISAAELARRANISKGYLSTIESSDEASAPRPSADVLFRIASALGTSAADLLGREVRRAKRRIPASLQEFLKERDLPEEDVAMLAGIQFRGAQPASAADWAFLYESIKRSIRPACCRGDHGAGVAAKRQPSAAAGSAVRIPVDDRDDAGDALGTRRALSAGNRVAARAHRDHVRPA